MKNKDQFLERYKISKNEFEQADISWEVLMGIYNDYIENRCASCQKIGMELTDTLFQNPKELSLHSYYWRVKNPEHLIAKIIRKRGDNYKKYKNLNEENYWMIVRDLVGFRGLIIFKEEWINVHEKILSYFKDVPEWYIDKGDRLEFARDDDCYLAEPTIAHVREGDKCEIYEKYLGSSHIIKKQSYRAVHYILKYHGVCVEFQLRTLFEDALGEMDHKIRYPLHETDVRLSRYAGIMNQLVGVVDELGSFYQELYREKRNAEKCFEGLSKVENVIDLCNGAQKAKPAQNMENPMACLDNIIKN